MFWIEHKGCHLSCVGYNIYQTMYSEFLSRILCINSSYKNSTPEFFNIVNVVHIYVRLVVDVTLWQYKGRANVVSFLFFFSFMHMIFFFCIQWFKLWIPCVCILWKTTKMYIIKISSTLIISTHLNCLEKKKENCLHIWKRNEVMTTVMILWILQQV